MQGHYGCVWFSFGNGPWENANFFGLKGFGEMQIAFGKKFFAKLF